MQDITECRGTAADVEDEFTSPVVCAKKKSEHREHLYDPSVVQNGDFPENSSEYVAAVSSIFPKRIAIDSTEKRAITLPQLEQVVNFAFEHVTCWRDLRDCNQLCAKTLNLYNVNDWLIRPSTLPQKCSMVELLATECQPPSWFVSHWWGEAIGDFQACLREHSKLRSLPAKSSYWVCAYANRQHCLNEEISADPKRTSFYAALLLSVGVLVVLDSRSDEGTTGPATAFTRIWCAYEQATALDPALSKSRPDRMLVDISVNELKAPAVLTDGSVSADEQWGDEFAMYCKSLRERSFPIYVIERALRVELQKAEATNSDDKNHILNAIANRPLELEPLADHERYEEVNHRLRAIFGLAAWPQAICARSGLVQQLRLPEIVSQDSTLRRICLNMGSLGEALGPDDLALLGSACPASLEELRLNFSGCNQVTDKGVGALSIAMARHLEILELNFEYCSQLTNDAVAALSDNMPTTLTELDVCFTGCPRISDSVLAVLGASLPLSLQSLTLRFDGNQNMKCEGLSALFTSKAFANLRRIRLSLRSCTGICGDCTADLAEYLHEADLSDLWIDLDGCSALSPEAVSRCCSAFPLKLRRLVFILAGCSEVSDDCLGAIRLPEDLHHFELSLRGCARISDYGLANLGLNLAPSLRTVEIDLAFCREITDDGVAALVCGIPAGATDGYVELQGCELIFEETLEFVARANVQGLPLLRQWACARQESADDNADGSPQLCLRKLAAFMEDADEGDENKRLFDTLKDNFPSMSSVDFSTLLPRSDSPNDTSNEARKKWWRLRGFGDDAPDSSSKTSDKGRQFACASAVSLEGTASQIASDLLKGLETTNAKDISLLVAFAADEIALRATADLALQTMPNAALHGGTSLGGIATEKGHAPSGLCAFAIVDPDGTYATGAAQIGTSDASLARRFKVVSSGRLAGATAARSALRQAGCTAASAMLVPPAFVLLSMATTKREVHEEDVLVGIQDVLGRCVRVFGGTSAPCEVSAPVSLTDRGVMSDCVCLTVAWPSVRCTMQFTRMHETVVKEGIATCASVKSRALFAVDGEPALDFYRRHSENCGGELDPGPIPHGGNVDLLEPSSFYPLAVRQENSNECFRLIHPSRGFPNGCMELYAPVAEGDSVAVLKSSRLEIVAEAAKVARSATAAAGAAGASHKVSVAGSLAVFCGGVAKALGQNLAEAVMEVASGLGDCPMAMQFPVGEQGPERHVSETNPTRSPTRRKNSYKSTPSVHANLMLNILLFLRPEA